MEEVPLDALVYRSYVVRYMTILLSYVRLVGEETGWEAALKMLSKVAWNNGRKWIKENISNLDLKGEDVKAGMDLIKVSLTRLMPGPKDPEEHAIVQSEGNTVVMHNKAWCPVLEACKKLGVSPSDVCPNFEGMYANAMLKTLNPRLELKIGKTRPEADYCEYIVELVE